MFVNKVIIRTCSILFSIIILCVACDGKNKLDQTPSVVTSGPPPEKTDPPIRYEPYPSDRLDNEPRIQCVAQQKQDNYSKIWSMKLDGSDRRLVAGRELLFDGSTIVHTPVRSPDGRYVALSMDHSDGSGLFRGLIDLKTQKNVFIGNGSGMPHFNWTSDGKRLIFYSDGGHYNFDVDTNKLSQRPIIYSQGLFLLPGDKEFLAFKGDEYWIHGFDGTVLRKVSLGGLIQGEPINPIISPSGGELSFVVHKVARPKLYRVNVQTGKVLFSGIHKDLFGGPFRYIYGPKEKSFIFPHFKWMHEFDFQSDSLKKEPLKERMIWGMGNCGSMTLYNID